jgi:hypothetical protein
LPSSRSENRAAPPAALVAVLCMAAFSIEATARAQSLSQAPPLADVGPRLPDEATAAPPQGDAKAAPALGVEGLRGVIEEGSGAPEQLGPTNYGKPRERLKLPKPYPPPRHPIPAPFRPHPPLPQLEAYRTSAHARAARRMRPHELALRPTMAPPTTVAVWPTFPVRPKPKIEERPFDPIGIGIGTLRLRPFVEASYGYDDNPNRLSTNVRGSKYVRGEAGFSLMSEWSRHYFFGDFRLSYSDYFQYMSANRPQGVGNLNGRYDVTRDTAILFDAKFTLDTLRPGSPNLTFNVPNAVAVNRPIILSMASTLGLRQKFNRLELTLRGTFERQMYQDALLSDATTLDLSSTDYNGYGGILRASYEINPDIKPFFEAALNTRVHDTPVDVFGYYRDSYGRAMRGGAEFRFSDLLRGEASAGYAMRKYADLRLPKLQGPTIDAALIYTPSALTTVTLRAATNFYETTAADASGVLNRTYTAQISHDFSRNLNATALLTYYTSNYQGSEIFQRGFSAGVRIEYRLARSLLLSGSYLREKLDSATVGADYTANVFLIGLRFHL